MNIDIHDGVRLVDAFLDDDYHTRDSCPGTVNNNKLIHIANQMDRRGWLRRLTKRVKNHIYVEEGTRNVWYKRGKCSAGIVVMGFSISRLNRHPKSVPMEVYANYFIDKDDPDWLSRNDYVLVK